MMNNLETKILRVKSRFTISMATCIVGVLLSLPLHAETITFGVYTSDKPSTMCREFEPVLTYLDDRLVHHGINAEIEIKIYPSFPEGWIPFSMGKLILSDWVRQAMYCPRSAKRVSVCWQWSTAISKKTSGQDVCRQQACRL